MAALTRSIAAGAVTALGIGTLGALAVPASAGSGSGYGERPGLSLTRSAALTLDRFDVDVDYVRDRGSFRDRGDDRFRVRGSVIFDGDGPATRWSAIRVNERTNRVTAVVNGAERRPVLAFQDPRRNHDRRSSNENHRTILRLTPAGARSIDRAAAADAFDAGDAFLKAGHRHR